MSIDDEVCTSCGVCKRVCPAVAVKNDDAKYEIEKNACLVCRECERQCKVKAISYEKKQTKEIAN